MDCLNKSPLPDPVLSGPYSGSSDLSEQTYISDGSEEPLTYHCMTVQIVDTPFPAYHNQSDIPNLSPDPIILLSEYGIKPLPPSDTEESFGTNTPDRSKSVSDQYTFENQTSSDNQTIQTKKIVEAPSSIMKRQSDPTSLEKRRKRQREQKRERYQNDPEFAERQRQRMRELIKSPGYLMRQQERLRERRKNPAYAERQDKLRRERQKERYQNDPAYAERERKRSREQRMQRRKNLDYQGIRYPGSST